MRHSTVNLFRIVNSLHTKNGQIHAILGRNHARVALPCSSCATTVVCLARLVCFLLLTTLDSGRVLALTLGFADHIAIKHIHQHISNIFEIKMYPTWFSLVYAVHWRLSYCSNSVLSALVPALGFHKSL